MLNKEEAIDKNHVKKANTLDIKYRLQILETHIEPEPDPSAVSNTSTTLAAEHAAPSESVDNICYQLTKHKTITN